MGRRVEGRRGYAETDPAIVVAARHLAIDDKTQRWIATELDVMGFRTLEGAVISSERVCRMPAAAGWLLSRGASGR